MTSHERNGVSIHQHPTSFRSKTKKAPQLCNTDPLWREPLVNAAFTHKGSVMQKLFPCHTLSRRLRDSTWPSPFPPWLRIIYAKTLPVSCWKQAWYKEQDEFDWDQILADLHHKLSWLSQRNCLFCNGYTFLHIWKLFHLIWNAWKCENIVWKIIQYLLQEILSKPLFTETTVPAFLNILYSVIVTKPCKNSTRNHHETTANASEHSQVTISDNFRNT